MFLSFKKIKTRHYRYSNDEVKIDIKRINPRHSDVLADYPWRISAHNQKHYFKTLKAAKKWVEAREWVKRNCD